MNNSVFTVNGNIIAVKGILDGKGSEALTEIMEPGKVYSMDFSEVKDINFAGMRALLTKRKEGIRFSIMNAGNEIAEKFEDSGVSSFINITRKPKPLDMGKWSEFGASFLSKAYNSEDGDSMLKIYGARVPKWMVAQEKAIARAVMVFGIPTPLVGTTYQDGDRMAIDFERIEGKRSFSRIISEEPERLKEISVRFARMCKHLHSTECDTALFADRTLYYRQAVVNCKEINEEERAKALSFIDSIPPATTCLHGDMQLSNVINNGKEDMWIDLSDFGYGNPMLDMGMWFFLSMMNPESRTMDLFHLNTAQMHQVWEYFSEEYFGADTPEKQAEVIAEVEPYTALHMLYIGTTYGFEPGMMDYIRAKIL